MNRLIIFLIRKKLGLRLYEKFQFENQKSKHDFYYFNETMMLKCGWVEDLKFHLPPRESSVCLNFLLSDECKVKRYRND